MATARRWPRTRRILCGADHALLLLIWMEFTPPRSSCCAAVSCLQTGRRAPSPLRLTLHSEAQVSLPSLKGGAGCGFTTTASATDIFATDKGARPAKATPLQSLQPSLAGMDYIEAASLASAAASEAAPEASMAAPEASIAASVASTAASVASSAGFSEQPARAKAVPATAARMSLRMRYNPWIEVNRAGQAARRKAYSAGRLRDPINRQFIGLQAEHDGNSS